MSTCTQGLLPATPATTIASLQNRQWIRIVFPGISDPQVRFDAPIAGMLSEAIGTIVDTTALDVVDYLTYPGSTQQEYLLSGWPATVMSSETGTENSSITDRYKELAASNVKPRAAMLAAWLDELLINRIGIEVVDVDVAPIGDVPTRVDRLVGTTTDPIDLGCDTTRSPFAAHVQSLAQVATPHLARTRIAGTTDATYQVTQQVARFGRDEQALYGAKQYAPLHAPPTETLADVYEPARLTSSRTRVADPDWNTRSRGDGWQASHNMMPVAPWSDADAAQRPLVKALAEEEYALLRGHDADCDRLRAAYNWLGVTPSPTVTRDSLTGLCGLVPNYEFGDWFHKSPVERSQPHLETITTVRTASGTDHEELATGPQSSELMTTDDITVSAVDVRPAPSDTLVRTAIRGFRARGDRITMVDGAVSPEATFVRTTPGGHSEPVLVGTAETLYPGDIIAAVTRLNPTQGLTIVTETEEDARWILNRLRTPFVTTEAERTQLYPCSMSFWEIGGCVALRPADESFEWWVTPSGEVIPILDGTELPAGTTALPPDPGAPIFRATAGADHYSVYRADGEFMASFESVTELANAFAPIPLPAIPNWLSALHRVTVVAASETPWRRVTPTRLSTGDRRWYEPLLKQFLTTYTCQHDQASLSASDITHRFYQYLHPQVAQNLPLDGKVDRTIDACRDTLATRTDIAQVKTDRPLIPGRDWRYPLSEENPLPLGYTTDAAEFAHRLAHTYEKQHAE